MTIIFPADTTVFAFFGARSLGEVHCFDCSLVSCVYQWIHVSSTVTKRRRNSFRQCLTLKQRQTLLCSGLTVALVVRSEKTRHPSRRQLSHAQYFVQDMTHALFSDSYCLSYLAHLQSVDCQHEIVDFINVILHCSRFRGTWAWLIKNRFATTLKFVKSIFDGHHRRRRVKVYSIQALFDFAARFPFQKQESNHRPILFFSIFVKSADTPVSTHGQNKTTCPIRWKF